MANKLLKKFESIIRSFLYDIINILLRNEKITEKINPQHIHKVLVIRYDVIGDMVVTLPMIKLIKELIPNAEIHLLASVSNSKIVENDNIISKIHLFDGKIIKSFFKLHKLRKENYDIIFSAFYTLVTRNGIICNIIGGRKAIKVNLWQDEKRYAFFNYQSKVGATKSSMWEKMYYMVADSIAGGEEYDNFEPYLTIPEISRQNCLNNLKDLNLRPRNFIAINLSAGRKYNLWFNDNYVRLIYGLINSKISANIILIYHPQDINIASEIFRKFATNSEVVKLYPITYDVLEIAALLEKCLLLITPDTGVVHICSALKTPVVAIYSEEYTFNLWKPYKIKYRALISEDKNKMIVKPELVCLNTLELLRELDEREVI